MALFSLFLMPLAVRSASYGLEDTAKEAGYEIGPQNSIQASVGKVVSTLLAILAIAFFILVTYAGLRWMTARGNDEMVLEAKNTLEAAVIGLIVVLSAYGITTFIFSRLDTNSIPATSQDDPQDDPAIVDCAGIMSSNDCTQSESECEWLSDPNDSQKGQCIKTIKSDPQSFCTTITNRRSCGLLNQCYWDVGDGCVQGAVTTEPTDDDGICVKMENNKVIVCGYSSRENCDAADTFYSVEEVINSGQELAKFCDKFEPPKALSQPTQACATADAAAVYQTGASPLCSDGNHSVGDLCGTEGTCQLLAGTQPYSYCGCR
ncbi:MAG: hypothetical protein A3I29_00295 [Candidatus Magasanikbacteria bacterium RIFCSPLOWO2_02_FULL_44_11]|uniref:Uncharacterized protein n=2 Tax=Candidatus Magasanikiibacteriota TaxID=1752731 RepID=A0A1F6N912_9BACT|nr:MAG: hypothetical protein A3I29_00295 [Candidatus Magasanikbacteria bacterium RIFCSPLOWO2_02_FULL_44_11]